MPEGPEVKIASFYYNSFFDGAKNIKFEILSEYYEKKYADVFECVKQYHPKYFQATFTIGKNIFLPLSNGQYFNIHLGMTGGWSESNLKHCHFKVSAEDRELFFRDVRKFGKMRILNKEQIQQRHFKTYDFLNKDYDFDEHLNYLKQKVSHSKSVCSTLMDQRFFPGVGNYIKSEALYAAKLHPEKQWGKLSSKKVKELLLATKDIMHRSFASGGAELKDFKNPFHVSKFELKVYGNKEDGYGNEVVSSTTSDQRKSWYCPKVQK